MSGKLPDGWTTKPFAILDARGWVYSGTRFVSPDGCDAGKVMLFESGGVAESFADHLRKIDVTGGIRVKKPEWNILRAAKLPLIVGTAPKTGYERLAEFRRSMPKKARAWSTGPP